MSVDAYDRIHIGTHLRMGEVTVTAADLSADGELAIQVAKPEAGQVQGITLLLDEGLAVSGISIWDGDVELVGEDLRGTFLVAIGGGSGSLLVSEDPAIAAARRFEAYPAAPSVGVDRRQLLFRYSVDDSRWVVPNWSAESTRSYVGATDVSGEFTVTYSTAFTNTPAVAVQLVGGTTSPQQFAMLTASSPTGFTVTAYSRSSVDIGGSIALLAAATPTAGLTVNVTVTPRD